jgi:hypothetical protein
MRRENRFRYVLNGMRIRGEIPDNMKIFKICRFVEVAAR